MFHITAIAVMPPNIKIINYCYSSSVRQCVKFMPLSTKYYLISDDSALRDARFSDGQDTQKPSRQRMRQAAWLFRQRQIRDWYHIGRGLAV